MIHFYVLVKPSMSRVSVDASFAFTCICVYGCAVVDHEINIDKAGKARTSTGHHGLDNANSECILCKLRMDIQASHICTALEVPSRG